MNPHWHPFGADRFGRWAERFARFFGTPKFIVAQTVLVVLWIALNAAAIGFVWDGYPFIALNLLFSLQAAYAAPLILLAQTRQADRDRTSERFAAEHRDQIANAHAELLAQNTRLTQEIHVLTVDVRRLVSGENIGRTTDDDKGVW